MILNNFTQRHIPFSRSGSVCFIIVQIHIYTAPVITRHRPNADLMLGQRRIRWANIKSALG